MSLKNPRLSITLTPKTDAILRRLSAVTGNSIGSIISDLLDDAGPVYERAAKTLEGARDAMAKARREVVADMRNDQNEIHRKFFGSFDIEPEQEVDARQMDLLDDENGVRRRARRASHPPYLTGGSQTSNEAKEGVQKNPAKPRPARKGRE